MVRQEPKPTGGFFGSRLQKSYEPVCQKPANETLYITHNRLGY